METRQHGNRYFFRRTEDREDKIAWIRDGPPIRLAAGNTYEITFHSPDVEDWISSIPALGIEGRSIPPRNDYVVVLTPTAAQRGFYNLACKSVCGGGHGGMHGAIEVD